MLVRAFVYECLSVSCVCVCVAQIIVFFPTARQTQVYAETFSAAGMNILEIHSRKSQVGSHTHTHKHTHTHTTRIYGPATFRVSRLCQSVHLHYMSRICRWRYMCVYHCVCVCVCVCVQGHRTKVSDQFRTADAAIMFSSDVSARGVDYPDVSLVVQVRSIMQPCTHFSRSTACLALNSFWVPATGWCPHGQVVSVLMLCVLSAQVGVPTDKAQQSCV